LDTALRRVKPLLNQPHVALFSADTPKKGEAHGLTAREVGILNWVRVGKTNSEIASILGISPYTVKNHLQSIFKKLDVYNRMQAIFKVAPTSAITEVSPVPFHQPFHTPPHESPLGTT
ncbi:MAG: LuxR C-terminal-related transcriptional regulator, partial [Nitrosospira sp.]